MTEKELRLWMLTEKADDAWWVRVDGNLLEEPMRLSAVFRLEGIQSATEVKLLHVSQKESEDPPWVDFDTRSKLDESGRKRLVKRRKLGRAFMVQVILLILVAVGVLFFAFKQKPKAEGPPLDPVEKMLVSLDQVQTSGDSVSEDVLPDLKAAVACTERVIYVSNLMSETWPECVVIIDGPDGFSCQIPKAMETRKTLSVPLRKFTKDGESMPQDYGQPKTVTLRVPGYRDWEERLR